MKPLVILSELFNFIYASEFIMALRDKKTRQFIKTSLIPIGLFAVVMLVLFVINKANFLAV